jgi:beta-lactamase regulating signal transducer with metallopeptidase domain
MRSLLDYLFRILSQYWVSSMWRAFWQGSLALAVVWAVCKAFPRISARVRCWLYRLGLAKPFLQLLGVPQIYLAVLPRARTVIARVVSDHFAEGIPTRGELGMLVGGPLMALWIIGVAIGLACVVASYAKARSMAMRSVPVRRGELDAILALLCRKMRIGCRPKLLVAGWASVPMTLQSRGRHVVVVPPEMLAPEFRVDLELALAHELAHMRRRDLNWNWLPTAARMLFFFNPLVWVVSRELSIAQEMACDEMAVRATGAGAARYGKALLAMVMPDREAGSMRRVALASAGASADVMRRRLVELGHIEDLPAMKVPASIMALLLVCLLVVAFQIVEAPRDGGPYPGVLRSRGEMRIFEPSGERQFIEGTTVAILIREPADERFCSAHATKPSQAFRQDCSAQSESAVGGHDRQWLDVGAEGYVIEPDSAERDYGPPS